MGNVLCKIIGKESVGGTTALKLIIIVIATFAIALQKAGAAEVPTARVDHGTTENPNTAFCPMSSTVISQASGVVQTPWDCL